MSIEASEMMVNRARHVVCCRLAKSDGGFSCFFWYNLVPQTNNYTEHNSNMYIRQTTSWVWEQRTEVVGGGERGGVQGLPPLRCDRFYFLFPGV